MKKTISRTARQNAITYGIVLAFFAVMQPLAMTGKLSSSLSGLLILNLQSPIKVYYSGYLASNLIFQLTNLYNILRIVCLCWHQLWHQVKYDCFRTRYSISSLALFINMDNQPIQLL